MGNFKDGKSTQAFNQSGSPIVDIDVTGMNLAELLFRTTQEGEGIKSVKGPLLEAVEKQQHVRLKNLNLAKPGSASALQPFLAFFVGDADNHTVYSPLGDAQVTLQRKDILGAVIMIDGMPETVDSLPQSLSSRLNISQPITPGRK